jgi:hypothetical protein
MCKDWKISLVKVPRKPLVVNDMLYRFLFDSMGDFGFGEAFKSLESGNWNSAQANLNSAMALLGPFSPAIWIPRIALAFIPGVWKVRHWFQMLKDADRLTDSRMKVFSSFHCLTL